MRPNTGEAAPAGYTEEKVSCRKPGSVSSSVLTAPPARSAASSTVTACPASARRMAAARPFGPAPITIAFMKSACRVEVRAMPRSCDPESELVQHAQPHHAALAPEGVLSRPPGDAIRLL